MNPVSLPASWRSVLPHLDEPLPPDQSPESPAVGDDGVSVNLPFALVRQSSQNREFWDIPA